MSRGKRDIEFSVEYMGQTGRVKSHGGETVGEISSDCFSVLNNCKKVKGKVISKEWGCWRRCLSFEKREIQNGGPGWLTVQILITGRMKVKLGVCDHSMKSDASQCGCGQQGKELKNSGLFLGCVVYSKIVVTRAENSLQSEIVSFF